MPKNAAPMFYGYVMETRWLYEYGVENHCVPTQPILLDDGIDVERSIIWNTKRLILAKSGLEGIAKFLPFPIDGKYRQCLVLTTNDPKTQAHMPLLPIERYAKLMEILEVDEKPLWWKVG